MCVVGGITNSVIKLQVSMRDDSPFVFSLVSAGSTFQDTLVPFIMLDAINSREMPLRVTAGHVFSAGSLMPETRTPTFKNQLVSLGACVKP